MEKILSSQYHEQAGFTKGRGIQDHITKLWGIIERANKEKLPIAIASIDIKGAYDGVDHEFLFRRVKNWKRWGLIGRKDVAYLRFLYS